MFINDGKTNFFKPLNSDERRRLQRIKRHAEWLEGKEERRNLLHPLAKSNLFRAERSAYLWAIAYIEEHNKKILENTNESKTSSNLLSEEI